MVRVPERFEQTVGARQVRRQAETEARALADAKRARARPTKRRAKVRAAPVTRHQSTGSVKVISNGGKQVNLVALGKGPQKDTLVVHYPAERAVLAVDCVWVDRLPYAPDRFGLRFPPMWVQYYPEIQ